MKLINHVSRVLVARAAVEHAPTDHVALGMLDDARIGLVSSIAIATDKDVQELHRRRPEASQVLAQAVAARAAQDAPAWVRYADNVLKLIDPEPVRVRPNFQLDSLSAPA